MEQAQHKIRVDVDTSYLEEQSDPKERRYVFSYTITIRNEGSVPARLLARHWIITDSNGKVQEVRGDGVVGEQPYLKPGQGFRYSSGAVLETLAATRWWATTANSSMLPSPHSAWPCQGCFTSHTWPATPSATSRAVVTN